MRKETFEPKNIDPIVRCSLPAHKKNLLVWAHYAEPHSLNLPGHVLRDKFYFGMAISVDPK